MRVALTGASGFIGSYTAATLHRAGHEVVTLVRPTSRRDHIEPFVERWVVGSQDEPRAVEELVRGVGAVIHNALDRSAGAGDSPLENFRTNVLGSLQLLESSRVAGAGQFVFVSSVAVHHEISEEWNGRITETHPTWPGGTYGAYKAAIEPHLKAYHCTYGMNTSAWRPAAVYGIDPRPERSQWYDLIDRARRDDQTIDTDRGGKITHVQDVADALTLAIGDDAVAGEFFNLVDCYIYWQQAAEQAKQISRSNANIIDRKGRGPKNQFDTSKAIAFFNRHGNSVALRRGLDGVRQYVEDLLARMPKM